MYLVTPRVTGLFPVNLGQQETFAHKLRLPPE